MIKRKNKYNIEKEIELVKKCTNGDSEAWREFYSYYKGLVISVIAKYLIAHTSTVNKEDLEDIFSIVWKKLVKDDYRNLKKTIGRSPKNWICTIALNTCRDHFKSSAQKISNKSIEFEADEDSGDIKPVIFKKFLKDRNFTDKELEDMLEKKVIKEKMDNIYSILSPFEKLIFRFKASKFAGIGYLTDQEIAEINNIERYTISRIWKKIIKKIKFELQEN